MLVTDVNKTFLLRKLLDIGRSVYWSIWYGSQFVELYSHVKVHKMTFAEWDPGSWNTFAEIFHAKRYASFGSSDIQPEQFHQNSISLQNFTLHFTIVLSPKYQANKYVACFGSWNNILSLPKVQHPSAAQVIHNHVLPRSSKGSFGLKPRLRFAITSPKALTMDVQLIRYNDCSNVWACDTCSTSISMRSFLQW